MRAVIFLIVTGCAFAPHVPPQAVALVKDVAVEVAMRLAEQALQQAVVEPAPAPAMVYAAPPDPAVRHTRIVVELAVPR